MSGDSDRRPEATGSTSDGIAADVRAADELARRILRTLSEAGRLGAMAEAMQTLLNEAMKLERSEFLRAAPGERTDERTGYANGFKDKALRTRAGELALRIPQVRPLPGGRRSASTRNRWSAGCAVSAR